MREDKPTRHQVPFIQKEKRCKCPWFMIIFAGLMASGVTLIVFTGIYGFQNPDQYLSGTKYDCFSGGKDLIGQDGLTYNFGIKVNMEFIYPDPDVFTTQMQQTFTTNVTKQFVTWFLCGFGLWILFLLVIVYFYSCTNRE